MPTLSIGTNQHHVQDYNRRLILNAIRLHGPLSRADLVRSSRLSSPAVSSIVAGLRDDALVREAGPRNVAKGRAPMDYEINPDGAYSIGLNLNRDSLVGTLVDLVGAERKRLRVNVDDPTPGKALPKMRDFVDELQHAIPIDRLWGVGVGVPGPIDRASQEVTPVGLAGWDRVVIDDKQLHSGKMPVFVENNATAAAIGEQWYGVGQRVSTFYYVFFGVGIGGGLIAHGRPYRGATGNVARLGRTGVRDDIGRIVALETQVSLTSVYAFLQRFGTIAATPEDLIRLHERGNADLSAALQVMAERLAYPIYNVDMQFDPGVIVFGGRLPRPLLVDLVHYLERQLEDIELPSDLCFARLAVAEAGEESAALGAATLPVYDVLAPPTTISFSPGVWGEGSTHWRNA